MPPPPKPPRKRVTRKSQSQLHQRGRSQEIVAKKQLLQFVKSEYSQKKPLEIRLLKMKPSIVFKRGSMLPHLLIKSLQQTAYVVYLDYGNELRYYFFSIAGISLGASTFEKTPQMLTELHGKAITLYKLPKHSALDAFDERSIKLNKIFQKELQKYERKWGLKIKSPPTFSIITNPPKYESFRWGVHQEGKIYHINRTMITDGFNLNQNLELRIILGREIFCLAWHLDPTKEVHQCLATFWVLSQSDKNQKTRFLSTLKKISSRGRLFTKFKEWILKIWFPYNTTRAYELRGAMLSILQALQGIGIFPWYGWGELILLYYMTHNQENLHFIAKFGTQPSRDHLVNQSNHLEQSLFEILQFLFTHGHLLQKFHIDFTKFEDGQDDFFLWLAYFCSYSSAHRISADPTTFPALIPYISLEKFPNLSSILEDWRQNQFCAAYGHLQKLLQNIPNQEKKFTSMIDKFLQQTIIFHISHGGIQISEGLADNLSINPNHPVRHRLGIENLTDVILKDAEYNLECQPSKNLTARFVSRPRSALFDTAIKFELEILFNKPPVSGKITLNGNFRHPFDNSRKLRLRLWEWDVAKEKNEKES
ncbi:MAG: hypothetical protein ACTSVZ_10525 [Promethearchaeota archaeon]